MPLDQTKLQHIKRLGPLIQCQCPACGENGTDKSGDHLRIYPDGRFGCALNPDDRMHRRRIWELARPDNAELAKPFVWPTKLKPVGPYINVFELMHRWRGQTSQDALGALATELGVSLHSLNNLGAAWASEHNAWAFPMFDEQARPIGIRLRYLNGDKKAVTGSRQGLFIPEMQIPSDVYCCEGPTDTAAMLTVGLYAIGRPSCSGGGDMLCDLIAQNRIKRVTIVADHDDPGIEGAVKLQKRLRVPSRIFVTPCKDFRQFVKAGATKEVVTAITKDILWTNPA